MSYILDKILKLLTYYTPFLSLVSFLALVVAKLSDLKKQSVYFWPTLYYYYYYYLFFIMIINIIITTIIIVLRHSHADNITETVG